MVWMLKEMYWNTESKVVADLHKIVKRLAAIIGRSTQP
jgi:hypothetical protein